MARRNPTKDGEQQMNDLLLTKRLEFKEEWTKARRKGDFAASLNRKVETLFYDILNATETATDDTNKSAIDKDAMVSAIEGFLDSGEENKIDNCILWLLLYTAAQAPRKQSSTAESVISNFIIKKNPYLSFDNPYTKPLIITTGNFKFIEDQCAVVLGERGGGWEEETKTLHFTYPKIKTTPFHHAVKHGKLDLVKCMKESLAHIDKADYNPIYNVIKSKEQLALKHTALLYASLQAASPAEVGSLETLNEILSFPHPAHGDQIAEAFETAVKKGADRVVDVFLDDRYRDLRQYFMHSGHISAAMNEMKGENPKERQSHIKIIRRLIGLSDSASEMGNGIVESIIELQSIAEQNEEREAEEKRKLDEIRKIDLKRQLEQNGNLKLDGILKQNDISRNQDGNLKQTGYRKKSDELQLEAVSEPELLGWMDIWDAVPRNAIADTSVLLHLAVYHQSLSFVTKFLEDPGYSRSVTVEKALPSEKRSGAQVEKEHYPLWYNSKVWEDKAWRDRDGSEMIRTKLVSATIRQTNNMQTLSDIFYKSGQPSKTCELCFDMSRFDSRLYRVSDFVYSLINNDENENLLLYEQTLLYAEFPALDLKLDDRENFEDNTYLGAPNTEVFDILTWLRDKKGVQQIIGLKVLDRLINPHDEELIAANVKKFQVERLDWRCLDLSLSVFGSDTTRSQRNTEDDTKINNKIKELHLYSSGKRAAIDHWLGREGIPTLVNLEKLYIHVVREAVSEGQCQKICDSLLDRLVAMRDRYYDKSTCKLQISHQTVNSIFWNPTQTQVNLDEIAHRINPRLAKFLNSLGDFIPVRKKEVGQSFSPTRVAIIDNGILSITPRAYDKTSATKGGKTKNVSDDKVPIAPQSGKGDSIRDMNSTEDLQENKKYDSRGQNRSVWSRIQGGRSFVYDGSKVCPWLFASDSHGTQMANLICAIDPFCDLYVARVAEGKYGITPKRTADAIEWALEKKVDIISMSITMLDPGDGTLKKQCQKALSNGVIIVCSTHDEGTRTLAAYPTNWRSRSENKSENDIIVITACDEHGHELRRDEKPKESGDLGYTFKTQGKNVAAGVIPFVESRDFISGSSVSTALVAGLSSLVLTCSKLASLPEKPETASSENQAADKRKDFKYTKGQYETVMKHLNRMAPEPSKHLLLEKFGRIDETTKEGDEISARRILKDEF